MASLAVASGSISADRTSARRLSFYALWFSILFTIFVMGPPFLGMTFRPYPLMHVADVFDLLTPLILMPVYWLLFRLDGSRPASMRENLAFMVLIGFWVLGQDMHLAANSIGHLTESMAGTDLYDLTYFYDETLSHYLWHFGVIGLSGLLIYRQWRNSLESVSLADWPLVVGSIVYGFTFFAMVIEGGTLPMGLSFAILAVVFGLIWGRRDLRQRPLLYFLLTGYVVSLVLFAVWGVWHQGFPQFSEVGFIK